jgi:hypothetical protein
MILKIFSPKKIGEKNWRKKWRFFAQTTACLCKNTYDQNIGFEKNANYFFAENWQKSQRIVIIASTPVETHSKTISSMY